MKISLETGINMTPQPRLLPIIAFVTCMALPAWGQQYLYVPQPVTDTQKAPHQEGILVQDIQIKKGDTLFDLSRKFSGRGMYYPQILLFNSIKNPNLIYPGATLKVPITQQISHDSINDSTNEVPQSTKSSKKISSIPADVQTEAAGPKSVESTPPSRTNTELSLTDLKAVSTKKNSGRHSRTKATHLKSRTSHSTVAKKPLSAAMPVSARPTSAPVPAASSAGQKLFETAVTAYRQNDCSAAVELFDRYLADNSRTPLAADATLYRADCYLKLSAQ